MRSKKWDTIAILIGVAAGLLAGLAIGSGTARAADVDRAEIMRLGDTVQHVTADTYGNTGIDLFVEAMRPPADDSDKWFITVIGSQNCPPCARLKSDWRTNSSLLALADPDDPHQSWAHWHYYDTSDQSQMWRFAKIKLGDYPTVLVQPPRSGRYGRASTVIYHSQGYDGDASRHLKT